MKTPKDFFAAYAEAALTKNETLMTGLYDDGVLLYDMWENYALSGIDGLKAMVREWFGSLSRDRLIVTFRNIQMKESDDIAWASALINFRALSKDGAELRSMTNRITVCFARNGRGEWKAVHQHTSVPISGKDTTAIFSYRE